MLESEYEAQQSTLYANQNEFDYQKRIMNECLVCVLKKLVSDSEFETAEYQYENARQLWTDHVLI